MGSLSSISRGAEFRVRVVPGRARLAPVRCASDGGEKETAVLEGDQTEKGSNLKWVGGWIAVAAAVAAGIYGLEGTQPALEFVTAYVIEYCLSVDNLFVFLLLFQYFKVPVETQPKILNYGVYGAMAMRLGFIVAGVELEKRFWWVSLIFAGILIVSAAKILVGGEEEDEDVSDNSIVKFARKLVDISDKYDGDNFWTIENGKRVGTPLLLCLLSVELSDVVFALDSVPACLAISKSAFIVYSSNILAIFGLRSLFFVVEEALNNLRYLQPSLAVVLGFVGTKMAAQVAGFEIGIGPSLGAVVGILGVGAAASLAFPEEEAV